MELRTAPIVQYSWRSRSQSLAIVLLFCALLILPLLGCLFGWQGPTFAESHNLAPWPDLRNTTIKDLPARIDAFYEDHVGFRRAVIRLSGVVMHRFFKEPSGDVIIGKPPAPGQPPWYFYASEGILEDRLGMGLLSPKQLEAWRRMLESRAAWLDRRGIAYLFVIVPEKSSVYPELLPDYIQRRADGTKLAQLDRYLKQTQSPAPFLNLLPALQEAKKQNLVYFPFDTHWNGRGMLSGYQAIVDALATRAHSDFEIRSGPPSFRIDLASMLGLEEMSETPLLAYSASAVHPRPAPHLPDRALYALETPGQRGRLLMFHDSAFIAPLSSLESQPLAAHFARSAFVWLGPNDAELERFIQLEHPDLVVEEHSERFLRFVP